MKNASHVTIRALVFCLVAATFTTIYITQPVLPVIRGEFGVDASTASLSVSVVILGIALANLPFGMLADRYPIRPVILAGGTVVSAASLVCAATHSIARLIAARFVQGLFIPSLSTCHGAWRHRAPAALGHRARGDEAGPQVAALSFARSHVPPGRASG